MLICRIFRAIAFTAFGWIKIIDGDLAEDVGDAILIFSNTMWGCGIG